MLHLFFIDLLGQKKLVLTYIALIIILTMVCGAPGGIIAGLFFSYKIIYATCMLDEVNKSYLLYLSLPIKRYNYIIEKHLLSMMLLFFGIFVSLGIDGIISKFINATQKIINYNSDSLEVIISISILLQIILQSIFFIQYFKSGIISTLKFTKPFSLALFILFIFGAQGLKSMGLKNIERVLERLSDNIFVICIVIFLVLFLISVSISSYFFGKRQF